MYCYKYFLLIHGLSFYFLNAVLNFKNKFLLLIFSFKSYFADFSNMLEKIQESEISFLILCFINDAFIFYQNIFF